MTPRYDIAIVGAGIVGLAHALAAATRGMRVIVVDRDTTANGASIRNFGFITVTGQSEGATWRRAMRSRDIWADVAPRANIDIVHRNECLIAHSANALEVLQQFAASEMGQQCELLMPGQLIQRVPMARAEGVAGALWSPHELRIEPRTAIPALASHLHREHGVDFRRGVHVRAVRESLLETNDGTIAADLIVVAPGPDLVALFPEVHARHGVRLCKLQMLRLEPQPAHWRLPAAIMSDFGLIRYGGFSAQPAANSLLNILAEQQPEMIEYGIHLIVVQSADGSLIVGDSHEYGATLDPFYSKDVEDAILRLTRSVLEIPNREVVERWIGIYPQSEQSEAFIEAISPRVRLVQVTSGTGMSTSFGLAEEVVADLCADPRPV